tara:strand:+ start:169 stop:1932 length:1764 start_codon:yes stop_codon:yes gene_type:complete
MKIQSYRSRGQRTDQVIAQPLQAQANTSAFESVGQAVAGFQQTADNASKWFATQQKLENATQVATGKRMYEEKLQNLQTTIEQDPRFNSSPIQIEREYSRRAKVFQSLASSKVQGRRAKITFNTEALDLTATYLNKVKSNARVRLTADATAETLRRGEEIEQKLSKLDPVADKAQVTKLTDELFGNPNTGKTGIYKELEGFGFINAEDTLKYEKQALNRIGVQQIEKKFQEASSLSGTRADLETGAAAAAARAALLEIPKIKGLTVQSRMDLQESGMRLVHQLERRQASDNLREEKSEERKAKKKQTDNFISVLTRIGKAYSKPDDQDAQTAKPTLTELMQLRATQEITDSQYNNSVTALNQQFAIVTDKRYFSKLHEDIRNASSKAEIEDIVNKAYAALDPNAKRKLRFEDVERLLNLGQQYAEKTPRAMQIKKYGALLDQLTKADGIMDKILAGSSDRAAIVTFQFDAAVSETDVAPVDAFRQAISQFKINGEANLNAIPKLAFPPLDENQRPIDKPLKDYTIQDIQESRALTLRKWKDRPSSLGAELYKLRVLQDYITATSELTAEELQLIKEQDEELARKNRL